MKNTIDLYYEYTRWAESMKEEAHRNISAFFDARCYEARKVAIDQWYYLQDFIEKARKLANRTIFSEYPKHHVNTLPESVLINHLLSL